MVVRHQRSTGEPFYGCTRFPDCRGTRQILERGTIKRISRPATKPSRLRLSTGGRYAKNVPEVAELVVARIIGRDLGRWEGLAVQLIALAAFVGLLYWFFASGLFATILRPFAEWYAEQVTQNFSR